MWEVFTCGKMPYGRLKNTEVVDRVQRGIVLEKPKACFKEVYDVSALFNICDFLKHHFINYLFTQTGKNLFCSPFH
jgi:hypothetical protein